MCYRNSVIYIMGFNIIDGFYIYSWYICNDNYNMFFIVSMFMNRVYSQYNIL